MTTYFVIHDGIDKHSHTVFGKDLEKNKVHRAFANILCCCQFQNIDSSADQINHAYIFGALAYMGGNLLTVQSMEMMSYFL